MPQILYETRPSAFPSSRCRAVGWVEYGGVSSSLPHVDTFSSHHDTPTQDLLFSRVLIHNVDYYTTTILYYYTILLCDTTSTPCLHPTTPLSQDLFPGASIPNVDYGRLQTAIESALIKDQLQPVPTYVSKIIQVSIQTTIRLYSTLPSYYNTILLLST